MRVLIVPDKFKGTLTAPAAAKAFARGWQRARPSDKLELLPMTDGGDGFGSVLGGLLGARAGQITTVDAAHRPCRARWWWEPLTRTAIIESAEVIGLAILLSNRFHPFELDTSGLGKVLKAVSRMKPRRCFIGIGGSATNDGGFGLARALGWRFLNAYDEEISAWPHLTSCRRIIAPKERLTLGKLIVALDVQNPLLGAKGCTRVYGPQKGIRPAEFKRTEAALRQLSGVMKQECHNAIDHVAGAGAAGGLGFGLMSFLNAKPQTGFSLFSREAGLAQSIRTADLVITGEGSLDQQSLMGKGVGELLALCERFGVPCLTLCGTLKLPHSAQQRFVGVHALTSLTRVQQALSRPAFFLANAAAAAGRAFIPGKSRRSRKTRC